MARIRSVKPELRTSAVVAGWPMEVRYFWVLLWGYLDDRGRGLDSPKAIAGDCFPHDDQVTERRVNQWLDLIATPPEPGREAPICRYAVGGRRYLHAVHWREHQRVNRPTVSRLPACPIHEALTEPSSERLSESLTEAPPVDNLWKPARGRSRNGNGDPGSVSLPMNTTGDPAPQPQAAGPALTEPLTARSTGAQEHRSRGGADARADMHAPAPTHTRDPTPEPPRQCPRHIDDPDPPACGRCADARRAHDAWELAQPTVGNPGPGRDSRPIPPAAQCPRHRGWPNDNCGPCRSERLAANEAER